MGGGYFRFCTKNRAQNHQKRTILHTSQANGGLEPPPPLATLLGAIDTLSSFADHFHHITTSFF